VFLHVNNIKVVKPLETKKQLEKPLSLFEGWQAHTIFLLIKYYEDDNGLLVKWYLEKNTEVAKNICANCS